MANFLTDGRTALLAAIDTDAAILGLVKRWCKFEGGLIRPYEIARTDCPLYALYPGLIVEPEQKKELGFDIEQQVLAQVTTEGDDPEPCEELIALTLERCRLSRASMLGLSSQGLADIVPSVRLAGFHNIEQKWLMWQGTITIALRWIRRRYV